VLEVIVLVTGQHESQQVCLFGLWLFCLRPQNPAIAQGDCTSLQYVLQAEPHLNPVVTEVTPCYTQKGPKQA